MTGTLTFYNIGVFKNKDNWVDIPNLLQKCLDLCMKAGEMTDLATPVCLCTQLHNSKQAHTHMDVS